MLCLHRQWTEKLPRFDFERIRVEIVDFETAVGRNSKEDSNVLQIARNSDVAVCKVCAKLFSFIIVKLLEKKLAFLW